VKNPETKSGTYKPDGLTVSERGASTPLLSAIGVERLTEYFEYLDALRESGRTNMYGASLYLRDEYPGMANVESHAILSAWMGSFSRTLSPEDRACNVIEAMGDRTDEAKTAAGA
jgi:hypothetical protein